MVKQENLSAINETAISYEKYIFEYFAEKLLKLYKELNIDTSALNPKIEMPEIDLAIENLLQPEERTAFTEKCQQIHKLMTEIYNSKSLTNLDLNIETNRKIIDEILNKVQNLLKEKYDVLFDKYWEKGAFESIKREIERIREKEEMWKK